jgi:hypothetical protein
LGNEVTCEDQYGGCPFSQKECGSRSIVMVPHLIFNVTMVTVITITIKTEYSRMSPV